MVKKMDLSSKLLLSTLVGIIGVCLFVGFSGLIRIIILLKQFFQPFIDSFLNEEAQIFISWMIILFFVGFIGMYIFIEGIVGKD